MDEILIEEKKYVSSKQAAKITGYAKDYIGQLCREGRVPARLVGRGWYVLESAIQDHRFGNQDNSFIEVAPVAPKESEPQGYPRYEASHSDIFPPLNRLRDIEVSPESEPEGQSLDTLPVQDINESWKEWFDTIAQTKETLPEPTYVVIEQSEEEKYPEPVIMDDMVEVPLHALDRRIIDQEFLTRRTERSEDIAQYQKRVLRRGSTASKVTVTIQIVGIILAAASVALACIGSGYFDESLVSNSQALMLSGGAVYIK